MIRPIWKLLFRGRCSSSGANTTINQLHVIIGSRISVNVNNVFNTRYWQGIPKSGSAGQYGDLLNLMFSLKWSL
jgi:outer membrane receptor for ferric coprogen and ferric-rhodotorulic acid